MIERAVISGEGPVLQLVEPLSTSSGAEEESGKPQSLAELEREHILSILTRTRWRIEGESGAASMLGLNPSTLRGRLRKLGIQRP